MQYSFPRHSVDDEAVKTATTKDHIHEQSNEEEISASEYRKMSLFEIGDRVLITIKRKI